MGRHDQDDHLRWMMMNHGGGQFCFGSEACERNNQAVKIKVGGRWDTVMSHIDELTEERYQNYRLNDGPVHDHLLSSLTGPNAMKWLWSSPKHRYTRHGQSILSDVGERIKHTRPFSRPTSVSTVFNQRHGMDQNPQTVHRSRSSQRWWPETIHRRTLHIHFPLIGE